MREKKKWAPFPSSCYPYAGLGGSEMHAGVSRRSWQALEVRMRTARGTRLAGIEHTLPAWWPRRHPHYRGEAGVVRDAMVEQKEREPVFRTVLPDTLN